MASDGTLTRTTNETWEHLEALAGRYGRSFYIADPIRFEENCRRFLATFQAIYPRTSIGYSYKTNYLPDFILRAHSLGSYSEVVSQFEFDLARALHITPERIIFNGPVKRPDHLTGALSSGAVVNADSIPEIHEMIDVADRLDTPGTVGVRCHLGTEAPDSRFGIDITAPDGAEALDALDAAPNLTLAGLHFHHSGDRSAEQYRRRTRAMINLHHDALDGRHLRFMDMGGGFAGSMDPALAEQLASSSATFDDYADAVAGEMRSAYGADGPELILEPGMALLADTMVFVTRVETVKAQHRRLAVVDGSGFNVQPPWNLLRRSMNIPIRVVAAPHETVPPNGPWDVVGHTCIEGDLLHRGHEGPIGIHDYVVVDNVGAYTNVLNASFIRGTPPIVSIDRDGSERLLRPRSTADDLLRTYATHEGER